MLRRGDSGPEVSALQGQLSALGFPLAQDGSFGPRTEDAVMGFQLVVGLVVDGIVGPNTEAALVSGSWGQVIDDSLVGMALRRHQRTDTVTTAAVHHLLSVDVKWPEILADGFPSPQANAAVEAALRAEVDDLEADAVPAASGGESSLSGEVVSTLLAPSIAGLAGVLPSFWSAALHHQGVVVTFNVDLAADELIEVDELFMPGSNWPEVLRGIVLLSFPPVPGNEPDPNNYKDCVLTPDGIRMYLAESQVGLPEGAGTQEVMAPWAKIESVVRPSIIARAHGHSPGGSAPLVP